MQNTICFLRVMHNCDRPIHHYCGYIGISNDNVSIINNKLLKAINDDEVKKLLEYDAITNKFLSIEMLLFYGKFDKHNPIIPISNIPDNWYEYTYYGFDLNHYNDNKSDISTNFEYAVKETLNIQKLLEELIAQYVPSTGD